MSKSPSQSRKRSRSNDGSTQAQVKTSSTTTAGTTTTTKPDPPPPRKKKSRFGKSTAKPVSDKAALLALIQQRTQSLAADLPGLIHKTGSGLAAAPELVLDKNGRDVASTSAEAAKRVRNRASLQINRTAARKKAVNPYLAHRSSSSSGSSSSSSTTTTSKSTLSSTSTSFSGFSVFKVDPRMKASRVSRDTSRDFRFVKAGTLVARAERLDKKENSIQKGKVGKTNVIHDMSDPTTSSTTVGVTPTSASSANSANSVNSLVVLPVAPVSTSIVDDGIRAEKVGCEWWDVPYLLSETATIAKEALRHKAATSANEAALNATLEEHKVLFPCASNHLNVARSKTWKLIQKPEMMQPVGESIDPGPQPIRLTHKERRKIRRRNRAEKQMEEQDKIRLGIIPAPLPKVAMKNLHRVLGNEAVLDPSQMEKDIKEGREQRTLDHEMRNLAAKKTPAERREKLTSKLKGDRELAEKTGIHVAVFKIVGELVDATKRFKIDMNARQLYLTGICLIVQEEEDEAGNVEYDSMAEQVVPINMVVVEGGKKGIKAYKKLMLRRIKWNQDHVQYQEDERARLIAEADGGVKDVVMKDDGEEDERDPIRHSKFPMNCTMVWEGVVADSLFKKFSLEQSPSIRVGRMFAKKNKCEQYWNMVEE